MFVILFLLLSPSFGLSNKKGESGTDFDSIKSQIKTLIKKYDIPGAAIAIINKDRIQTECFGYAVSIRKPKLRIRLKKFI